MLVSRKCRYALRAILELAMRNSQEPTKIADIAKAQAIPTRFLETILNQLKQAGFVESRRGRKGGYFLKRSPNELTMGDVIESMQGCLELAECVSSSKYKCPFYDGCVFLPVWKEAQKAVLDVYDGVTFRHLVDAEQQRSGKYTITYSI